MMRTKWMIILFRIIWLFFIFNHEFFAFWKSAKKCAINSTGRIMLIADPQITDDKSYKKNSIIISLAKFYSSLYMKRNYKYLTRFIQPTDIFITGDLMDNGREWDDGFFDQEVNRFHTIFPPSSSSSAQIHYMAGNHDIGFGNGVKYEIQQRFKSYFGNSSYIIQTQFYSFIVIDTVSLSSDDSQVRQDALSVLLGSLPDTKRILMTHVPLYRDSSTTCGAYRQRQNTTIRNVYGYQYQNLVSYELSNLLLDKIQPVAVFSADDHDYCKVFHKESSIVEITVPTFSMAQGMQYPGLVMLDISDPNSLSTELCWLPDQIGLFVRYGYLLALTFVILIFHHTLLYHSVPRSFRLSKEEMGIASTPSLQVPISRPISSFFYTVKEIALTSLPVYILCILFI